jgi:hypothetical protein
MTIAWDNNKNISNLLAFTIFLKTLYEKTINDSNYGFLKPYILKSMPLVLKVTFYRLYC